MKIKFLVTLILATNFIKIIVGQAIIPSYVNNFDSPNSNIGWTHYALNGSDDWQMGAPNGTVLNYPFSYPNVWGTNLSGCCTPYSTMCLESPYFDLSDTTVTYVLGFVHNMQFNCYSGGNLEFSKDSGLTWQLLNGTINQKIGWYNNDIYYSCVANGESCWITTNSGFMSSYHLLDTVAGYSSVKFRFKFGGQSNTEGWVIDNFSITKNLPNLAVTSPPPPVAITKKCPSYDINTKVIYGGVSNSMVSNKVNYFLSNDSIFDVNDSPIGSVTKNMNTTAVWTQTFTTPSNINAGKYYVFYTLDSDNTLVELNEFDNLGFSVLIVDSIYQLPLVSSFDDAGPLWKGKLEDEWKMEPGKVHGSEGTHSGNKAWSSYRTTTNSNAYIASPHINLSSQDSLVYSFWYKMPFNFTNGSANLYAPVALLKRCNTIDNDDLYGMYGMTYISNIYRPKVNGWNFCTIRFTDTSQNAQIVVHSPNAYGYTLDDFYVGKVKADLSIESDKLRFTSANTAQDSLKYLLTNSGLKTAPTSSTSFYWSNDSILDSNDILLGTKQETSLYDTSMSWKYFNYTKPTLAQGKYYIIYKLDANNVIDEMREYDNVGYFTLFQQPSISLPYFNDFETQIDGWYHNASLGKDDWQWTTPKGKILDTAFSGTKVWITNDTGLVSPMSRMHLYSPIFDLTSLNNPVLDFDMKLHSHNACGCEEGKTNMSYSIDKGATWNLLDTTNHSFSRWYYNMDSWYPSNNYLSQNYSHILTAGYERTFSTFQQSNGKDAKRNTKYILDLNFLKSNPSVMFRFNLATLINNSQSPNFPVEGALIDNFSVNESSVDLLIEDKKALMISSKSQSVKFFMNIRNKGNYISLPCTTEFYLSIDSVLDISDYLLGQENIPAIQPDRYYYINTIFNSPSNLSTYKYLLYNIDNTNINSELNELNNIGYWPLALDSIKTYPYFNNFNDTIINGWHQYSIGPYSDSKRDFSRINTILTPAQYGYSQDIFKCKSGEWNSDRISNDYWAPNPYLYLETPAFDFSKKDSIFLSFNLMITGAQGSGIGDGGNFHFSKDGGNNWTLLTDSFGVAQNWYNSVYNLPNLDNELGWTGCIKGGQNNPKMDTVTFDASFLKGEKNIQFRFKYKSKHQCWSNYFLQGFRLDDFKIEAFSLDYIAKDSMVSVNTTLAQSNININYLIKNEGQTNGRITSTKFYWSKDSIFDSTDTLIKVVNNNPIPLGTTVNSSVTVTYPSPINQTKYYLFYIVDADSNLVETNENNNIGSYIINFAPYTNYYANVKWDTINVFGSPLTFNSPYSIINNGFANGVVSTTDFYWSSDTILNSGDQIIQSITTPSIIVGDTLNSSTIITYPIPITQPKYYLFYKVDNTQSMVEGNENDNVGIYKVIFDTYNSIKDISNINSLGIYTNENYLYIISKNNSEKKSYELNLCNTIGQTIYTCKIELNEGLNKYILPNNISSGLYLISLHNYEEILTRKLFIKN